MRFFWIQIAPWGFAIIVSLIVLCYAIGYLTKAVSPFLKERRQEKLRTNSKIADLEAYALATKPIISWMVINSGPIVTLPETLQEKLYTANAIAPITPPQRKSLKR